MVVGVCRLRLSIPGNDSLKGKRSVVRSILDRVRARFHVAIAEVEEQDAHELAVIGLAVVSNEAPHANEMIDRIVDYIEREAEATLLDRETEIVHFGDDLVESGSWTKYEDDDR